HYQLEAKTNPFYALGPIFYLVWFIVMLTGLVLIMWYVPTKPEAFDSIFRIQNDIPLGGLIRGMHKYGADAMIIAATMRMYRMFINADYKPGKEFNIAIGLIALLLSMYSGLTGYLLIWNQRAFWATKVFATFPTYMDQFPVMGDFYQPLVKSLHLGWNTAEVLLGGGAAITQETITRFFSLHLAFSLIPLILVELYFYKNDYTRIPLNWTKRWIVIMMLVVVAIILPAAQGHRSNPDVTPLPILSDWYFLGLYQMYKYLEPVVATEITMVIPLSVMALPFIEQWVTGPEKDIMKRPFVLMVTLMGFFCWIIFSYLIIINIANIHNDPPYWRDFLFGVVDVGILWQLVLMFNTKDVQTRLKNAKGCIAMGILALIQTILAVIYYFMARTEIFMDPLMHSGVYSGLRGFMGDSADKAEGLVRQLLDPAIKQKEYYDFHNLLDPAYIAKIGEPAGKDLLLQLQQVCQQTTPLDGIFKLIPTFEKAPHAVYNGMVDFMVNNRWCFDYVNFCDRYNGVTKPYPMPVPELDWVWMVLGAVALVGCAIGYMQFSATKPAPAPAKPVQPAATAGA
ncbi:MAG TPA: cytochrome b N-terminal domain-containing protein, partial [Chroococcales cyanobacterium]